MLSRCVADLAGDLPGLYTELRARWLYAKPDGYPRASMSDRSAASHETDPATGLSVPLPVYSDPTGDTATTEPGRDEDASVMADCYRLLRDADNALRSAHGRMIHALHPSVELGEPDDLGCASCRRLRSKANPERRVWEPTYVGQLCRWCSGWNTECGQWPPLAVIRDHHDGKRINVNRMIRVLDTAESQ